MTDDNRTDDARQLLEWVTGSEASATILRHLLRSPGRTSDEVAGETDLHPSTVRVHLKTLVDDGYATREKRSVDEQGTNPWEYQPRPVTALAGCVQDRVETAFLTLAAEQSASVTVDVGVDVQARPGGSDGPESGEVPSDV